MLPVFLNPLLLRSILCKGVSYCSYFQLRGYMHVTSPCLHNRLVLEKRRFSAAPVGNADNEDAALTGDKSLAGRYGLALYNAAVSKNSLDRLYQELSMFKQLMSDSGEFTHFINSPGISSANKQDAIDSMGKKFDLDVITTNFLKVLVENRRLSQLPKLVEAFEAYYRKHKGETKCLVTSAKPLNSSQQKSILTALQKRSGPNAKLIVDYAVQPSIIGGLVVRLGDSILDFSVSNRLESIKTQLLLPVH